MDINIDVFPIPLTHWSMETSPSILQFPSKKLVITAAFIVEDTAPTSF